MFERLADVASEHAQLERDLADPAVHADADRARTLGRRYAEISPMVHAYQDWVTTCGNEAARSSWPARTPRSRPRPSSWPPAGPSWRAGWSSCWCPGIRSTPRTPSWR